MQIQKHFGPIVRCLSINGNEYWQSNRIYIVLLLSQLLKQDMIMDIWYSDKHFKFLSFHGPDNIHKREDKLNIVI